LRHAFDLFHLGDEMQRLLFQRRAKQQHIVCMRHAALDHHAPWLAFAVREAQARERPAHFHRIAIGQQVDCAFDRVVGAQVFLVFIGTVDAVAHDARHIDANELRRAAVASRVDPDADEVLVPVNLVAPRQRAVQGFRVVIPGADAEHQRIPVHQHAHRGTQVLRRIAAILRLELVEARIGRRQFPGRVIEPAIQLQRKRLRRHVRSDAAALCLLAFGGKQWDGYSKLGKNQEA
jgi:hypothetical protein